VRIHRPMSLDDFKSGSPTTTSSDGSSSSQTKSLARQVQNAGNTQTKDRGYCPECGNKGEETEQWYYRCTSPSDECSVITFIKPIRHKNDES